ncbi:MAG: AAA family ATPase, partial [Proteobacteria bacterium]|nr:AAA family ATPase [Pseudomonadota bacterium]
ADWAIAGRFQTAEGVCDIGTGSPPGATEAKGADRRVFRLDGAAPRSQTDLAARVAAVWLTPQMDRIFSESTASRRRFLDRLVWALEPGHARQVAAYEAAMAGRNRLLAQGGADPSWLAALEASMARHAVAATVARVALIARLNALLEAGLAQAFPTGHAGLSCPVAAHLAEHPALATEDWLRDGLARARPRDAASGSASLGAHRADLTMTDAGGMPAALASTGEQKSLLIGLILSHTALIGAARGFAPILLFDEPAVHLDPARRAALFEALVSLPGQTLMTGTDAETFAPLAGHAETLRTGDGRLAPAAEFAPPISDG